MRPPLSKEMWYGDSVTTPADEDVRFRQWNGKERSVFFEPPAFYTDYARLDDAPEGEDKAKTAGRGGIAVLRGRRVVRIDPDRQVAALDNGKEVAYDKCLLATGGRPKSLPVFDRNERLRSKVRRNLYKRIAHLF